MANEVTTPEPQEMQTREKQSLDRELARSGPIFKPEVDILEREDAFVVVADLPGADSDGVEVNLREGVLSIDARLAVTPDSSWQLVHAEYRYGGYHRRFDLSDRIDPDGIEASMRDGVLELLLPKLDRHRPRTIEVRAG